MRYSIEPRDLSNIFSKELHSQNEDEIEISKERYISPKKKIKNYWWVKIIIII